MALLILETSGQVEAHNTTSSVTEVVRNYSASSFQFIFPSIFLLLCCKQGLEAEAVLLFVIFLV